MSDEPNKTTRPRRHSQLPKDLQELVDKDEQFRDSYGDFENSWTTTRRVEDEPANKSSELSFQQWAQEFMRKTQTEKDSGGS